MRLNNWPHHCAWSASRNGACRVLRNPLAHVGDLQQFLLPWWILFLRRQFSRELRVTPGPGRHGVAGHDDGIEERLLVDDVARLGDRGQLRLGLLADPLDAARQDLREIGRPVLRVTHGTGREDDDRLHEQVVWVRAVQHEPRVLRQGLDEIGGEVPARPVRSEDLADDLVILRCDGDIAGLAFVLLEHLHPGGHDAAVELGIDDAPPSEPGVGPPDEELVRKDRHGHLLDKVLQRLGPAQHQWLALGRFERFGEEDRAIQRDPHRAVRAHGLVHPHDPVGGRSVKELCAALDGVFLCRQYCCCLAHMNLLDLPKWTKPLFPSPSVRRSLMDTRSRCGPNPSSMIALRRESDSGVGDLKSLNW